MGTLTMCLEKSHDFTTINKISIGKMSRVFTLFPFNNTNLFASISKNLVNKKFSHIVRNQSSLANDSIFHLPPFAY